MATATTTTLRQPGSRPAWPQTVPAGCWLLATSRSAPRSTSTTGCSPSTHATPTEASSLTPTSCPAPAPATSPRHPPPPFPFLSFLFSQKPWTTRSPSRATSQLFILIYFLPKKRTRQLLASAPNGTAQHLGRGLDGSSVSTVIKKYCHFCGASCCELIN